jgi:hypothetical protein
MHRFAFPLETALRWRQAKLEAEESRLRGLFVELAGLEQAVQDLDRSGMSQREYVQNVSASPAEREGLADYLHWSTAERTRLLAAAAECRTRIAAQRSALLEARRNHELLVKLKSRKQHEWDLALAKELDELASEACLSRWNSR